MRMLKNEHSVDFRLKILYILGPGLVRFQKISNLFTHLTNYLVILPMYSNF